MENGNLNPQKHKVRGNWKIWLFVLLGLQIITFLLWLYIGLLPRLGQIEADSKKIFQLNYEYAMETEEIEALLQPSPSPDSSITLSKNDAILIKNNLIALKTKVDNAMQLTHQDVINIVDRVNLYVTIGIVLLTLIGVFLPIIVQKFGRDEIIDLLNHSHKRIEDNTIAKLREHAKILKRSKKVLNNLKKEVNNIPPLRLSHSLLFALDKNLIVWYSKEPSENRKLFLNAFESISKDLNSCYSKGINVQNKDAIKTILLYFRYYLHTLMITFMRKKENLKMFQDLQLDIDAFLYHDDIDILKPYFNNVIRRVEKIVDSLKNSDKQNSKYL